MKTITINLSDKDYELYVRIARSSRRRLQDLNPCIFAEGLRFFFSEEVISVKKTDGEYTAEDAAQQLKNSELEKTEGFSDLSYEEKQEKGFAHVDEYLSNHEQKKQPDGSYRHLDSLIEPLAESILDNALGYSDE